jgi:hypothetical protein
MVGYAGGRIAAVFSKQGKVVLGVSDRLINDQILPGDVEALTDVSWDLDMGDIGHGMRGIVDEYSESRDDGSSLLRDIEKS